MRGVWKWAVGDGSKQRWLGRHPVGLASPAGVREAQGGRGRGVEVDVQARSRPWAWGEPAGWLASSLDLGVLAVVVVRAMWMWVSPGGVKLVP